MDEIPVALREAKKVVKSSSIELINKTTVIISFSLLALIAVMIFLLNRNSQPVTTTENPPSSEMQTTVTENPLSTEEEKEEIPENILGHLPYEEASLNELKAITIDGGIKLRHKAADKFLQMQRDAKAQGVILTPISGFRSIKNQEYLFFQVKEQRKQATTKRAEVSAPPGYSEHHTGYAIDIGDGNAPATNLSTNFEKTSAYQWLSRNAAKYSFEISFTPDNLQGISYEPWHWRFVGDTHSLETFYKARQLNTPLK